MLIWAQMVVLPWSSDPWSFCLIGSLSLCQGFDLVPDLVLIGFTEGLLSVCVVTREKVANKANKAN